MQRTESPGIETPGIESPGIKSPGIESPGIKSPCIKTCIEKSRKWIPHVISLFFALACYAGFMLFNPLYISTDNIGVAVVTEGYYGENNFCQYIHPLLCLIIKWLTPLFPPADVFTLLVHIAVFCSIALLFDLFAVSAFTGSGQKNLPTFTDSSLYHPRASSSGSFRGSGVREISITLTTGMSILLFSSGITVWNANYTIQTAAIVLAGLLILFTSMRQKRSLAWLFAGTLIISFGFMLRIESALLFLPFIALEVLSGFFSAEKNPGLLSVPSVNGNEDTAPVSRLSFWTRFSRADQADSTEQADRGAGRADSTGWIDRGAGRAVPTDRGAGQPGAAGYIFFLPAAVIIFLLLATRFAFNLQEPYKTAGRYNAARTAAVDFPMKSWNAEIEAASSGHFSKTDYEAVTNWCFFDTEFMDVDMLESVVNTGRRNDYSLTRKGMSELLGEMKWTLLHSSLYMVILIGLSTVLAFRNLICCPWPRKAETVLSILGVFIILTYFTFRGRAPMRVWESVIFAMDFVLFMAATDRTEHTKKNVNTVCFFLMFILLWFSTGQLLAYVEFHKPQPVWVSRIPEEGGPFAITVSEEAGEDSLFIWPNWHTYLPKYAEETGKLPSRELIRHNIALGDWVYGQPYFTEFLGNINAQNPARALLERPNTYLMGDYASGLVLDYFREHYGAEIDMQAATDIGKINNVMAYRFIRKEVIVDQRAY
ncbi:hypothetical protein SAMN04487833_11673 [Sarcina sp. DSM 11001]|nr:hypothetical protein SAMN04487833_11673 [Sarcina sp. DSM 11001]